MGRNIKLQYDFSLIVFDYYSKQKCMVKMGLTFCVVYEYITRFISKIKLLSYDVQYIFVNIYIYVYNIIYEIK